MKLILRTNTKMSDSSKFVQQGFWALGVFFGLFIIWASFVPLDEGVPLVGNVVIDTKEGGTASIWWCNKIYLC